MLFRVEIKNMALKKVLGTRTIIKARSEIILYAFGTSERLLDSYLRTTFNIGLKEACLTILANLKQSSVMGNEIIYVITDENLDKLAQLITCGIGETPGSLILLNALGNGFK